MPALHKIKNLPASRGSFSFSCVSLRIYLSFLALRKCAQAQSNPIILLEVIVSKPADRLHTRLQTDTFVKSVSSNPGDLKMSIFHENWESNFSYKINTFFDESVKIDIQFFRESNKIEE